MPKIQGGSLQEHRRVTRDRIFETFSRLLYERGYDAITLADVAAGAGMSRTAMYNHFPDKNELVIAFTEHATEQYVRELKDALGETANPVDQLRVYIRHQFRYFSSHHLPPGPALQVLLAEGAFSRVMDHVGSLEITLRRILEAAVTEGYVERRDLDATLPLVAACINASSMKRTGPMIGPALDAVITEAETFVLNGLGVRFDGRGKPRRHRRPLTSP